MICKGKELNTAGEPVSYYSQVLVDMDPTVCLLSVFYLWVANDPYDSVYHLWPKVTPGDN